MTKFLNNTFRALRIWLVLTILTGLVYPWIVIAIASIHFQDKANGDLVIRDGKVVGSKWIAQAFEQEKYFWPRPSAIAFNPLPSGGSNLSPTSAALHSAVEERRQKFPGIPGDLLYASASGLDPHISPDAAIFQIERVARSRKIRAEELRAVVDAHIEPPDFWIFGEPRVNVLLLNLALDEKGGN